jgi:two-component system, NtrC family, nitrogen regulation sensor histidine kinase NtrY
MNTKYADSFAYALIWRLLAIMVLGAAAVTAMMAALREQNTWATTLLLLLLIGILLTDVLRLVTRTNLEMARLANALQFGDFSQSFQAVTRDANFPELGQALDDLVSSLRTQMIAVRSQNSHLESLIDHVPIPLLSIDADERVVLLNNAARRLFNRAHGTRLNEFAQYGQSFIEELRSNDVSRIVCINPPDDAALRMRLTQTRITLQNQPKRLIALQPIQSDIDAAELTLSNDLVRVLTHEIMNSLTPVTSLAKSALALSKQLPTNSENQSLAFAIETVARRADGLMQFVGRYQEATGTPILNIEEVSLAPLFTEIKTLFRAEYTSQQVQLEVQITPSSLSIKADRQLLEHVLINLLRNAAQASISHTPTPNICVRARNNHNGRIIIDVEDNGGGIPEPIRTDIFLPFFTTKIHGSGIGLSFARQIVLAHGGAIRAEKSELGGACLRLVM